MSYLMSTLMNSNGSKTIWENLITRWASLSYMARRNIIISPPSIIVQLDLITRSNKGSWGFCYNRFCH